MAHSDPHNDREESKDSSHSDLRKPVTGWVSLREFAQIARVSYPTVTRWTKLKMINFTQVGGQKRIYEEEIRRFIENGTLEPDPEAHAEELKRFKDYQERRRTRNNAKSSY